MSDNKKQGRENRPMENLKCEVTSCIYNDHKDHCTARQIKVGPSFAMTMGDTACETFIEQ